MTHQSDHEEPWDIQNDDPRVNDLPPDYTTHLIMIEGHCYEIESYDAPRDDGSRIVTLREVAPF